MKAGEVRVKVDPRHLIQAGNRAVGLSAQWEHRLQQLESDREALP